MGATIAPNLFGFRWQEDVAAGQKERLSMRLFWKIKSIMLLMAALMFLIIHPGNVQSQDTKASGDSAQEVQEPVDEHDLKPETGKIDQAGSKIGEKIEQFGDKASDSVGGWINSKVVADISWLKLLFCVLLVFVVVTVERMVRLMIQRKSETIPQVDGQISWLRLILRAVIRPLSLLI